jgi:hypothetical protein
MSRSEPVGVAGGSGNALCAGSGSVERAVIDRAAVKTSVMMRRE